MGIAENYLKIKEEIAAHAKMCGRNPEEIMLLPVTKTHPLDHIMPAYREGARAFGENKIQDALPKMEQAPEDIAWHMIGTLQKNKVRKAVGRFALIHSVDSLPLAQKISTVSEEVEVVTPILLEVNTKHSFTPDTLREQLPQIQILKGVRVEGVMTMAPFVEDEQAIRNHFSAVRRLRDELGLKHLSMGMTHDYPIAIEEGATIIRVGTAIFGIRD